MYELTKPTLIGPLEFVAAPPLVAADGLALAAAEPAGLADAAADAAVLGLAAATELAGPGALDAGDAAPPHAASAKAAKPAIGLMNFDFNC